MQYTVPKSNLDYKLDYGTAYCNNHYTVRQIEAKTKKSKISQNARRLFFEKGPIL